MANAKKSFSVRYKYSWRSVKRYVAIAKFFFISESTVKKTLQAIYQKLHAKDRTNAVNIAWQCGILNENILKQIAEKYSVE